MGEEWSKGAMAMFILTLAAWGHKPSAAAFASMEQYLQKHGADYAAQARLCKELATVH